MKLSFRLRENLLPKIKSRLFRKEKLRRIGRFVVPLVIVAGSVYCKAFVLPCFALNTFDDYMQGQYNNSSMTEILFKIANNKRNRNLLLLPLFRKDTVLNRVQFGLNLFSIGMTSLASTDFVKDKEWKKYLFIAAGIGSAGSYVTERLIDSNFKNIEAVMDQFNQNK